MTVAPFAVAVMDDATWATQFGDDQRARLGRLARLASPTRVASLDDTALGDQVHEIEVLITSWGVGPLTAELLDRMPKLRAVFHAAGSVRGFATNALWERGIVVSTSADLNADPVAEFTLAAIIMAGKKAPFFAADLRAEPDGFGRRPERGPLGNVGRTIGIVGFSRIGRRVVELIARTLHRPDVLVADPFAEPGEVARAGARLVPLDELLPRVDILSLHAPALPSTERMIGARELAALPDHAVVINTARGVLIDHHALERECVSGRLHAILDVTDPEPLHADSPLYVLPNVSITPHISGSVGAETRRMADGALDELERHAEGRALVRSLQREEFAISA